jgi:3'(2'), 5'-bisphosphate nucleotidase
MNTVDLLDSVKNISKAAGKAILEVYQGAGEIEVITKADNSPLTQADLAAHRVIVDGLNKLNADIPILSEESDFISWEEKQSWETYWLVDPLDGTKEFINRNGEFTVNIALIENGVPVLGVVYVPVLDVLYFGARDVGAHKEEDGSSVSIHTASINEQQQSLRVVASRSHRGELLEQWLENAGQRFPNVETLCMGSSLKICLVAEGKADIYPRLALTSEWDTAAAQAVLEAAGGMLTDIDHNVYRYNKKENILNPYFFAVGDQDYPWSEIC